MQVRMPGCQHCPYTFMYPSRVQWREVPLLLLLRRPYRCGCCKTRYLGRYYPIDYLVSLVHSWLL